MEKEFSSTDFRKTFKHKFSWKPVIQNINFHENPPFKHKFSWKLVIQTYISRNPVIQTNFHENPSFKHRFSWKPVQWELSCSMRTDRRDEASSRFTLMCRLLNLRSINCVEMSGARHPVTQLYNPPPKKKLNTSMCASFDALIAKACSDFGLPLFDTVHLWRSHRKLGVKFRLFRQGWRNMNRAGSELFMAKIRFDALRD